MRSRFAAVPLVAGALTAIAVAVPSSAAPDAGSAQKQCTVRNAIYAIVDDSGSMAAEDPAKLRVQALKQLKATPGNERKLLGALEFGTDAQVLFNLLPIAGNTLGMDNILDGRILADNGGTDYNDAFLLARTNGGNADRFIFLTDGAHGSGAYAEGHSFGKTVDVIGLGNSLLSSPTDDARLAKIASDTGGLYKKAQNPAALQTAMNEINAAINCQRAPVTFVDTFNRVGQAKVHAVNTGTGDGSVQFAANWATPGDAVDLTSFTLTRTVTVRAGASQRRRRRTIRTKLRAIKRPGASFTTVKVRLPRKRSRRRGKLRFRVKATRIANPAAGLQVTTQASRSRRR